MVDNKESHWLDEHLDVRLFIEHTYRSSGSQNGWVFDSGVTSISISNKSIFKYMNLCQGSLTIASELCMPIRGRGIVRFDLARGQQVRLGGVIYVLGLAENLLSLKMLHLARFESRGSSRGYELTKNGEIVAHGKRVGWSTYLDTVKHRDTLLVGPDVAKRMQYAQMALSADEATAKKQALIHYQLGHPGRQRFNDCLKLMDLDSNLQLGKGDKMLDDSCEVCSMAKKIKSQSHISVRRATEPLQHVYMDFWGPSRETMSNTHYFLSLIDDHMRYSWLFVKPDRRVESLVETLDIWLP